MLLYDPNCSDSIIDYNVSFDNESREDVLGLLTDCFKRREIVLQSKETFLLHGNFNLEHLKRKLDKSNWQWHDLLVYYYTFDDPISKTSEIGNIYLGNEVKVTSTVIKCPMASTIAFILHHLNKEERIAFINNLTPAEQAYLNVLLDLSGSERLSCLLDTTENIEAFLRKCQCLEETMSLDNLRMFEKIWYFKTVFAHSTLTASESYSRAYLNSIIPIDDMECEDIQNIQEGAKENTEIVKQLSLKPKRIIY